MIQVENVSKSFRVAKRNAGFKEAVKSLLHREYEVVQALNRISFTIPDGEMVGYIGPNGAGKSSSAITEILHCGSSRLTSSSQSRIGIIL